MSTTNIRYRIQSEHIYSKTDDDGTRCVRSVAACGESAGIAVESSQRAIPIPWQGTSVRRRRRRCSIRRRMEAAARSIQAGIFPRARWLSRPSPGTCAHHPRGQPLAGQDSSSRLAARSSQRARMFRKDSGPFLFWVCRFLPVFSWTQPQCVRSFAVKPFQFEAAAGMCPWRWMFGRRVFVGVNDRAICSQALLVLRPSPGHPGADACSLTIWIGFKHSIACIGIAPSRAIPVWVECGNSSTGRAQAVMRRLEMGFDSFFPRHSTSAFE
jgi:hypothetical protein